MEFNLRVFLKIKKSNTNWNLHRELKHFETITATLPKILRKCCITNSLSQLKFLIAMGPKMSSIGIQKL